jgi:UDP-glucuronate 4-epimerase
MKILVTGTAGFIGFHLVERLMKEGCWEIVGLDNINDYYDVNLKYARLKESGIEKEKIEYNHLVQSSKYNGYRFTKLNLEDREKILKLFENEKFDYVFNLAAQAGVRYSLENPYAYVNSNIIGFLNLLETCRKYPPKHILFASSSSVYGANKKTPFSVTDYVDHPISLYAVTKKSNELMAHTYSALFNLSVTGLRFFTVYGPWGRPDMALFIFTKKILNDEPIDVYNNGEMKRDFTYIDDIIESVFRLIKSFPLPENNYHENPSVSFAPFRIYNIGNNSPVQLLSFINSIEKTLGKKAKINYKPIQPGDVPDTFADVKELLENINFSPSTPVDYGIKNFIEWYTKYYNIKNKK